MTARRYHGHRNRIDPASFGVNVFCLEDFDVTVLSTRGSGGLGMSLVDDS